MTNIVEVCENDTINAGDDIGECYLIKFHPNLTTRIQYQRYVPKDYTHLALGELITEECLYAYSYPDDMQPRFRRNWRPATEVNMGRLIGTSVHRDNNCWIRPKISASRNILSTLPKSRIIQNRGRSGIAMEIIPSKPETPKDAVTAVTFKEMKAFSAAAEALRSIANRRFSDARDYREGLLGQVRTRRATIRSAGETVPSQVKVTIIRNGIKASSTGSDKRQALEGAKNQLRTIRAARKRIGTTPASTRSMAGGTIAERAQGGWFFKKMKEKARKQVNEPKSPPREDTNPYVGIEIECFMPTTRDALSDMFIEANLSKYVSLVSDSSIEPTSNNEAIEVRILCKQDEVDSVVRRVCDVLAAAKAAVNKSCGMHVHLDCRRRTAADVYSRLVAAQPLLMAMVPASRRSNNYCQPNKRRTLPSDPNDRYMAINPCALSKHRTMEVRLHSSTVEATKITNWVRLLTTIADGPTLKAFPANLTGVIRVLRLPADLASYIETRILAFYNQTRDGDRVPFLSARRVSRLRANTIRSDVSASSPSLEGSEVMEALPVPDSNSMPDTGPQLSYEGCTCLDCTRNRALEVTAQYGEPEEENRAPF